MTTLQNGDKKISVRLGTTTSETKTITTKETIYVVTLPTIICNNEEDAKTIQATVDQYVSDLVKEVLSKEEQ